MAKKFTNSPYEVGHDENTVSPIRSVRWVSHEYPDRTRSNDWYWAVGIIVLAITIGSVIFKNYLFAILILMGGILLLFYAIKKPEQVDFEVNDLGIRAGERMYPMENIQMFWIEKNAFPAKLIFRTRRSFLPIEAFPIEDDSIDDTRAILRDHLPEEKISEPTEHLVMDQLGF